jgi:3-oxoadipate CoA-transferase beta subunit
MDAVDEARIVRRDRRTLAARVAADIPDGWYVNLGIGIPTMVAGALPADREIVIHSENGILGVGPRPGPDEFDPELIDAGKEPVTLLPGGAYLSHADSFAIIRGGHLDLVVLGAYQVSERGDLANWSAGNDSAPAVGGAMDLSVGAKNVWVMMDLVDRKSGVGKLVDVCTYPLTAPGVVRRVYTDLGTFEPGEDGVHVVDLADGVTVDHLRGLCSARIR